jgi:hypothetical protein
MLAAILATHMRKREAGHGITEHLRWTQAIWRLAVQIARATPSACRLRNRLGDLGGDLGMRTTLFFLDSSTICARRLARSTPLITSDQSQVSVATPLQRLCIRLISCGALWPLEHRRTKMQLKLPLLMTLALAALAAIAAAAIAGPREEPGECGAYRYWQDGQCTDARDRKRTKSWQEEILAKQCKP